eukprot:TRINITY_DN3120_c0_g9_i2.p1 TRINITY_DN3120_c0_g9~~TRINITY_DN3120_c0_g9_i2.p1  ORF type:complete len:825 (+),score=299.70 TRINITY_DN3120_c0_g9_i2:104-2476(+)
MAGLDFGSRTIVLSVAFHRTMDVVLNEQAKRQTPNSVAFTPTQRFIGAAASQQQRKHLKTTVSEYRSLIGLKYDDPAVRRHKKEIYYPIKKGENGEVIIPIDIAGDSQNYTPERIASMLLSKINELKIEKFPSLPNEYVIAVPCFFTHAQRVALLNATRIAGMKCLSVIDETSAVALTYGLRRYRTLPLETEDPHYHIFADMGHSSTQLCVCKMRQGHYEILATACDSNLGGRNFDQAIMKYAAKFFEEETGLDIFENPKAVLKLEQASEKAKQNLTTLPDVTIDIECVMEDEDLIVDLSNDDFNNITDNLIKRFEGVCHALKNSEKTAEIWDKLTSIVITGGSTRLPRVQQTLCEVFNVEKVHRTLNPDESISTGCCLLCANMSDYQKITKKIKLKFPLNNGYLLTYPEISPEGELISTTHCFDVSEMAPIRKNIPIFYHEPFSIIVSDPKTEEIYNVVNIGGFPEENKVEGVRKEGFRPYVAITCGIDYSGLFYVKTGTFHDCRMVNVETKVEEPIEEELEVKADENIEEPEVVENNQETESPNIVTEPTPEPGKTPDIGKEEKKEQKDSNKEEIDSKTPKKPKTRTVIKNEIKKSSKKYNLNIQVDIAGELPDNVINEHIEHEGRLKAADRKVVETANAKVHLESFCYDAKACLLDGKWGDFIGDIDIQPMLVKLDEMVHWLYEDGKNTTKKSYDANLKKIMKVVEPVRGKYLNHLEELRKAEEERKRAEEEAKRKAEEEAKKQAEEAAKKKKEEEEAKKQAEEKAKEEPKLEEEIEVDNVEKDIEQ